MIKKFLLTFFVILFFINFGHAEKSVTYDQIINLVNKTAEDIKKNADKTFKDITDAKHPYMDKEDNKNLYVFVYDTNVNIVADYNKALVGKNKKNMPDVEGKDFRNKIVNDALKNKTGWIKYSYVKPGTRQISKKTTYYKLVTGSNKKQYIVCAGKYLQD